MTTFHVSYDLGYLIRLPDADLLSAVSGDSAAAVRASLVCMKASGRIGIVVGPCDHQSNQGQCLGHEETSE